MVHNIVRYYGSDHTVHEINYKSDVLIFSAGVAGISAVNALTDHSQKVVANQIIDYAFVKLSLPRATICDNFATRHAVDSASNTDHRYYDYFRAERKFFFPLWMEKVVGKQIVFSINNGCAKYYQKEQSDS